MFKRFRRRILAAEHRPAFDSNERVLAWCTTSAGQAEPAGPPGLASRKDSSSSKPGQAVIATNLGLWRGRERTGWHEISKAQWDGQVLTVIASRVVERRDGYEVIEDLPPERLVLVDPNHLPHQVHLRVSGSVKHPLQFSLGWLAARRVPGENGLSWTVRYEAGVDRTSPQVIAATDVVFKETHWKNVAGSG